MRKALTVLFAASLPLLLAAPLVEASEIGTAAAKATFEDTCSKCHPVDTPLGVTGRDRDGWTATVKRMSGHHQDSFSAPIPAADQAAIVEYLVKNAGKNP
jgi:hypothetical protein